MGSCLYDHLRSLGPVGHVVIYCDRCSGQNLKFQHRQLAGKCTTELPIETVDLKFLQLGHSFNDCDRQFNVIQRHLPTEVLPAGYMIIPKDAVIPYDVHADSVL